jgi:hypothetical protein
MKEKQRPLTPEEIQSQKACDALRAHEETKGNMIAEFNQLDEECVKLASQVHIFELAGSARGFDAATELQAMRAKRDNVSYSWKRTRDFLENDCIKFSFPVAQDFFISVRNFVDWCTTRRDVQLINHVGSFEAKRNRCKNNFSAVSRAITEAFKFQSKVQSMACRPLAEINDLIEEYEAGFRKMQKQKEPFPFEEAVVSEVTFSEMTAFAFQPTGATQTSFRRSFA